MRQFASSYTECNVNVSMDLLLFFLITWCSRCVCFKCFLETRTLLICATWSVACEWPTAILGGMPPAKFQDNRSVAMRVNVRCSVWVIPHLEGRDLSIMVFMLSYGRYAWVTRDLSVCIFVDKYFSSLWMSRFSVWFEMLQRAFALAARRHAQLCR